MKRIAVGMVVWAAWALGQTAGTIEGVVWDASRSAVEHTPVTVTEKETGLSRTVRTGAGGRYVAAGLLPGQYRVEAAREGFRTAVVEAVRLSAGRTVTADMTLVVGERREQVQVRAEAAAVSTSAADWGGTVERAQLEDLPLNGRDLFDLAAQQPAVTIANNNEGAIFNGLGIQPAVNGNRPNQNSFRIDGVYVNDASGSAPAAAGGRLLGVEGIEELRLITNPFSAEYGRAASAMFTAVSRSGGNDWHGSLYYYLRNSATDAKNFFDAAGQTIPALRRNHFGGMVSGALKRDRLFWMANYEGLRESRSRTQSATTLTAAAREGLLPAGRVTVSDAVKPFLSLYPLPNGRDYGDGTAEYLSMAENAARNETFSTRVDWLKSERVRAAVRFATDGGESRQPDQFRFWEMMTDSRFAFVHTETTLVQSPATLWVGRFGYSRVRNTEDATPPALAKELTFVAGRPIGTLEVTGLTDLTSQTVSSLPRLHVLQDYQGSVDGTHVEGAQTWRFGASFDEMSFQQRGDFRASGRYRFTSVANLLRATPSGGDLMAPGSDTKRLWRQRQYAFFAQDEWRALRRLSVVAGVRYEGYTAPSEADSKIATMKNPLADKAMTLGGPLFRNPSKANFAPRAGVAWDARGDGRTVVRAGAGMFFDLLTSREVTIAGMRVPPFYNRAFLTNPKFPDLLGAAAAASLDNSQDGLAYAVEQPYVLQWRVSVSEKVAAGTVVEAGYSGSRGAHLLGQFGDVNVAQGQVQADGRLYFPPTGPLRNPAFGRIGLRTTDFNSFYHALTVRVERRMGRGAAAGVNYTWAKAVDESSSSTQTDFDNSDRMPHPYNIRMQRGPADFDVRQALNATGSWVVPGPRGGVWQTVLGGWQVQGIVQAQAGFPFNPRVGFDQARMRSGFGDLDQRPSLKTAAAPVIFGDPALYYDPASFALPEAGYLGNLGRNTLTGPGLFSLNAGVHKTLVRREGRELRLRVEWFNATNHPNFDVPSELRLFTSGGGRVGSTGRITTTATAARQMQAALRWTF